MNILVALSGGVDSSVTAALLKKQGHRIVTVTLKTFCYAEHPEGPKSCCGLEGVESARAVARSLDVPHFVFDVSARFKEQVIEDFVAEYAAGRTPNPCVACNATVKIPDLLERGKKLGCEYIATGHYAQVIKTESGVSLLRGKDRTKDQAYFLWALPSSVIERLLLPLGEFSKPEVRAMAAQFNLFSANKPESQEICFIPNDDYVSFLRQVLPATHPGFQAGNLLDSSESILGTHDGYLGYTVGQRKGLGGGHGRKLFVKEIRAATREIVVGESREMTVKDLWVDKVNLLAPEPLFETMIDVQIRHRSKPIRARRTRNVDGIWHFRLEEEARAVTPGQSAVFFSENRLLGGGRIISSRPSIEPECLSHSTS